MTSRPSRKHHGHINGADWYCQTTEIPCCRAQAGSGHYWSRYKQIAQPLMDWGLGLDDTHLVTCASLFTLTHKKFGHPASNRAGEVDRDFVRLKQRQ